MSKFQQGNHKASRLTAESVYRIRSEYAAGLKTQVQLAREHQVSINTIRNIVNGVSWQNVPMVETNEELAHRVGESQRLLEGLLHSDSPPESFGSGSPVSEPIEDPIEIILRRRAAQSQEIQNEDSSTKASGEAGVSSESGKPPKATEGSPPKASRPPKAG